MIEHEVVILQRAESDWYALFQKHGESFDRAFERVIQLLAQNPGMGTIFRVPPYRRLLIQKTPYGIFYTEMSSRVIISAILDLRQSEEALENLLRQMRPDPSR